MRKPLEMTNNNVELQPTDILTDYVPITWSIEEIDNKEDPKRVCIKLSNGGFFIYPTASAKFILAAYEESTEGMKSTISKLNYENLLLKTKLEQCKDQVALIEENTMLRNKLINIKTNIKNVSDRVNHIFNSSSLD